MSDLKNNFDEDISASIELNYRRYLIKVLMVVALPALTAFGIRNFMVGRYFIGLILSSMVVILASYFFERIFDPFFYTKETGKGTGLGRASVSGII